MMLQISESGMVFGNYRPERVLYLFWSFVDIGLNGYCLCRRS